MSRIARVLARRLCVAGANSSALAAVVSEMAAARAEAINSTGLEAQITYLLETYGPDEIEAVALGNMARGERP